MTSLPPSAESLLPGVLAKLPDPAALAALADALFEAESPRAPVVAELVRVFSTVELDAVRPGRRGVKTTRLRIAALPRPTREAVAFAAWWLLLPPNAIPPTFRTAWGWVLTADHVDGYGFDSEVMRRVPLVIGSWKSAADRREAKVQAMLRDELAWIRDPRDYHPLLCPVASAVAQIVHAAARASGKPRAAHRATGWRRVSNIVDAAEVREPRPATA